MVCMPSQQLVCANVFGRTYDSKCGSNAKAFMFASTVSWLGKYKPPSNNLELYADLLLDADSSKSHQSVLGIDRSEHYAPIPATGRWIPSQAFANTNTNLNHTKPLAK